MLCFPMHPADPHMPESTKQAMAHFLAQFSTAQAGTAAHKSTKEEGKGRVSHL